MGIIVQPKRVQINREPLNRMTPISHDNRNSQPAEQNAKRKNNQALQLLALVLALAGLLGKEVWDATLVQNANDARSKREHILWWMLGRTPPWAMVT